MDRECHPSFKPDCDDFFIARATASCCFGCLLETREVRVRGAHSLWWWKKMSQPTGIGGRNSRSLQYRLLPYDCPLIRNPGQNTV